MKQVVFDSSFLLAVMEKPTTWLDDITTKLGGFQPVMLDCVRKELSGLAVTRGKKGKLATLALEASKSFQAGACGTGHPDDEILRYATSRRAVVATLDRGILEALKRSRLSAVTLRGGRVAVA